MSHAQTAFDAFRPEAAWAPFVPTAADPWNAEKVAHLYRRALGAPTAGEIAAGVASDPATLFDRLLAGTGDDADFDREVATLIDGAFRQNSAEQLKGIWFHRLLRSPHPFRERMTLFWHDHFATSNAKVRNLRLIQRQNDLLRRHALGRFDALLAEMTFDPAMLVWLDSASNRVGQPNENYAREVFELFSLGVGNYSETDIREAARALTGWSVRDREATFDAAKHDAAEKTILGRAGRWSAGDVVRIALEQPACPRFLVRKLFAEFVSETVEPSDEALAPLVDGFRQRNFDVAWLLRRMLTSRAFHSQASIRQRVRGPVELVVGTVRALEGRVAPIPAAVQCDRLGQSLFHPPSVKGWDGGGNWLNSTTLLARQNFAFEITSGTGLGQRCDPAALVDRHGPSTDADVVRFFLDLFHQQPEHSAGAEMREFLKQERRRLEAAFLPAAAIPAHLARTAAHLALTLPEYQLC